MPLPAAVVTIQVTSLEGLPAAAPGAGNTRYARATFQGGTQPAVRTGRSRPIPDAGGSFDMTAQAELWSYEAWLDPGGEITINVELLEDHGDYPPPAAVSYTVRIADPWTPGSQTLGTGPQLIVEVKRELVNPVDQAFLARAGVPTGKSGALVVPQGYVLEFEDIDGLYQPDPAASIPMPGSKKVAGYISNDNLGRIFTNRKPDGTWASGTQFIDVSAKLTAFGGVQIPAAAVVHWTIEDADDPTNDEPDFHREWGPYVDANDYDTAGDPQGATPADNASAFSPGNTDEDKLLGMGVAGTARWDRTPAGPAPSAISRTEATTPITPIDARNGKSSVRIHCFNVLGTNMVLRMAIDGLPAGSRVFAAATGVMTMWSRIQVEVVKMDSAHSLSGALPNIPKFFLPARVQLDFEAERSVATVFRGGVPVQLDKKELSADEDHEDEATSDWINDADVFRNAGKGGWFFFGAAQLASPLPPPGVVPPPLYDKTKYTLGVDAGTPTVEIKKRVPTATFATFVWNDAAGNQQEASFWISKVKLGVGKSTLYLSGNDVTPSFSGHDSDGSLNHAYRNQLQFYPQHQSSAAAPALVPGGFGVPAAGAELVVDGPGATFTSGISPSQPNPATGLGHYFAGRTVVFTHTPSFSTGSPPMPKGTFDAKVLSTAVHEFIHAFGMPHKCGLWNWRTPRLGVTEESCCMNYFNTWLIDAATNTLIPDTAGKQGNEMCGRHLIEIRRVHLENNKGLGW